MLKTTITLLAACVAVAAGAQSTTIYSGSFEQRNPKTGFPACWGMGDVADTSATGGMYGIAYKMDGTQYQDGRYSLLIDWKKQYGNWTAVTHIIPPALKGKEITLTGYLKTEYVTGTGAGLWLRIDGQKDVPLAFDNMMDRAVTGTTGWTQYTITLPYNGEEAKDIAFGALITGQGRVWIDNLTVTIKDADVAQASENALPKPDPAIAHHSVANTTFRKAAKSNTHIAPSQAALTALMDMAKRLYSYNNGDSDLKALSILDAATDKNEKSFEAYKLKLMFYYRHKEYDKAIIAINHCVRLHPDDYILCTQGGVCYENLGDQLASKVYFDEASAICNGLLDTMNTTNEQYLTISRYKAINLILLEETVKANDFLQALYPTIDATHPNDKAIIYFLMDKEKKDCIDYLNNPEKYDAALGLTNPDKDNRQ